MKLIIMIILFTNYPKFEHTLSINLINFIGIQYIDSSLENGKDLTLL